MGSEFVKKLIIEDKDFLLALGGIALFAIGFLVILGSHPGIGGFLMAVGGVGISTAMDRMEANVPR